MHAAAIAAVATRGARLATVSLIAALFAVGCGGANNGATADESAPGGAEAASASSGSDDVEAISRYTLTMDKMDKFVAAMRNIAVASKDMPEEESNELDMSNAESVDEYAALLESRAPIREAIESADLSAREFATITLAYVQAGMASSVIAMQPNADADSLARSMRVNPANIKFLEENEAELTAKMEKLDADMGAMRSGS